MAHSLSAKKRVRQAAKRAARNRARRQKIKVETKAFNAAVAGNDVAKAEEAFRTVVSTMMRVSGKSTMHRKTAARRRSKLARRLNALKAGAGAQA